ncbi:MAG: hypothetical protein OHK0046_24790 [Anaerolineae bacterium]
MRLKRLLFPSVLCLLLCLVVMPVFAAPIATVTLNVPAEARMGEPFTFTVTFDNTHPSDVGYGPFIDLILPFNGADGAGGTATPDGIDFISAEYINAPVNARVLTFPASGCVNHPFLRDTNLDDVQVCGTPGDKLVILELPFGSYVPDQPPVDITVNALMSNLADLGTPLSIQARGGFRFGETPVDDPCCDPPTIGTTVAAQITPVLLSGTKENNAPEGEIATGPNHVYTWTITLDVADGQTITDVDVTDYLPNNVAVLPATINITPATGTLITAPPANTPVNPPNNTIVVNFPSITGTNADNDIVIAFDFYVPYADANGNPTVNPGTGDDSSALNNFSAVGDWGPDDPRDAGGVDNADVNGGCPTVCPGGNAPEVMSIAGQKSGLTVPAGTPIRAGTVIEFTIAFQVSDFFAFNDVVINDILPDGLQFDATFAPVLTFTGTAFNGAMTNFTAAPGPNGTTLLEFRITDELGGPLVGGCVPAGGTGGGAPNCATFNNGASEGTLRYRTIVLDNFVADFPSGDPSVDHGDTFLNQMNLSGQLLDVGDVATDQGTDEDDDSENTSQVARGVPVKSLYAVNGVPCGTCEGLRLAAGDTITYRIRHDMPSTDFEDFSLVDFLPLPVFRALEVTTFSTALDATIPPAGTAKLLVPGDTLHTVTGTFPTLLTDDLANSVTFFYGSFDSAANPLTLIDILFTVTMRSDPIADGLQLTNQIQAREASTNSGSNQDNAIAQVQVTSPFLSVTKGAIATSNPNGQFIPASPGPVPFNPPGSPAPFGGVINSDALAAQPIDSDLTGLQPGDLVTFAVVIENLGSSRNGAFDIQIRDILPPGFIIPPGAGLNLTVTLGTGQTISWFGLNGGGAEDFFNGGIELVDPGLDTGVCGPYNGVSGTNIIIITYTLQLNAPPTDVLTNITTVTNYSSEEGGADHTGGQDLSDETRIGLGNTDLTTVTEITQTGTGTGIALTKIVDLPFALPGETVTWTVRITNNGALAVSGVQVRDTLPAEVERVEATASSGTVTQNGATYTLDVPIIGPGETVTLTIQARLRGDLTPPYLITNTATAFLGGAQISRVDSSVTSAQTMADTGESPYNASERARLVTD